MMVGIVSGDIEVDRAATLVGISGFKYLLYILYLFYDMSRGMGFDRRGEDIERLHVPVIADEIMLHHFHRLEHLEPRLLGDLVLTLVGIMLEMAHICDVADITHLVSEMTQIAEKDVEGYRRARMAQMGVAIDGRPAHVHAYVSLLNRMERTA